jgi:hypothetical protein
MADWSMAEARIDPDVDFLGRCFKHRGFRKLRNFRKKEKNQGKVILKLDLSTMLLVNETLI